MLPSLWIPNPCPHKLSGCFHEMVTIFVMCTFLPFPLIHMVGYCVFIFHLSYPPIETLQVMGNFELANSAFIGPHNLGPAYPKRGGEELGLKPLINLSDYVVTHGAKRVFWTMVFGSLHDTWPLLHVSRASWIHYIKRRLARDVVALFILLIYLKFVGSNGMHHNISRCAWTTVFLFVLTILSRQHVESITMLVQFPAFMVSWRSPSSTRNVTCETHVHKDWDLMMAPSLPQVHLL